MHVFMARIAMGNLEDVHHSDLMCQLVIAKLAYYLASILGMLLSFQPAIGQGRDPFLSTVQRDIVSKRNNLKLRLWVPVLTISHSVNRVGFRSHSKAKEGRLGMRL